MAEEIELDEVELGLLREVRGNKVCYTRGVYRYIREGNRAVPGREIQRLRALGLVVLTKAVPPIPPTRFCELTDAGRAVLDRTDQQPRA